MSELCKRCGGEGFLHEYDPATSLTTKPCNICHGTGLMPADSIEALGECVTPEWITIKGFPVGVHLVERKDIPHDDWVLRSEAETKVAELEGERDAASQHAKILNDENRDLLAKLQAVAGLPDKWEEPHRPDCKAFCIRDLRAALLEKE